VDVGEKGETVDSEPGLINFIRIATHPGGETYEKTLR
jgi:hypothetical protein